MHIDEPADAQRFQPLRLGLEISETGATLGSHDQHPVVVPGWGQLAVVVEQSFALQALANLTLACFQIAQGVVRVNGIDLQADAVLGFEHGPRSHQELDAGTDLSTGGGFERGQDPAGRVRPDDGIGLRSDDARRIPLGDFQVNMAVAYPGVHNLHQRPDTGLEGLRNSTRDPLQQLGQRDTALPGRDQRGSWRGGRKGCRRGRRRRIRGRQPLRERRQLTPFGYVPLAACRVPPRSQGLDAVLVGEGRDKVSAAHTAAAAGGGAPWAPRRQAGRSVNSREQPEQTSRAA